MHNVSRNAAVVGACFVAIVGCDSDMPGADYDAGTRDTLDGAIGGSRLDGRVADAPDALGDADRAAPESDAAADAHVALEPFSFFVTSQTAMLDLAREFGAGDLGFGGDLRFGETGEGAGLRGADKICTTIAESSMPGSGAKGWRAFLSTRSVNARDRIGSGPWYDRRGRLIAQNLADLLQERPRGPSPALAQDLPNESGTPNQFASGSAADNHDILTGTNAQGVWGQGDETCNDWTTTDSPSGFGPQLGHSWCLAAASCGGGVESGLSWIAAHFARGCAASVNLVSNGGGAYDGGVGDSGGYGGIYCLALAP